MRTLTRDRLSAAVFYCRQASSVVRFFASFVAVAVLFGHMGAASAGLAGHQG